MWKVQCDFCWKFVSALLHKNASGFRYDQCRMNESGNFNQIYVTPELAALALN